MSDTSQINPWAWVSGILSSPNDKNVPKELRQRIALAMMTRNRPYPKTFGEGLAAIGNAIGDRGMRQQLEDEAAASEVKGKEFDERISVAPPSGVAPVAAAPAGVVPQVQTVQQPLLPARPLPPDQQQSEEPGAPVRMPTAAATQDWRTTNPLPRSVVPPPQQPPQTVVRPPQPPPVPPQARSIGDLPPAGPVNRLTTPPGPLPPGNIPAPTMQERLAPAFPGQQSALSGAPVMAEGGNVPDPEEMAAARGAIAQAMMQQQAARGGPQPLPTPRAVTPPPPAGGQSTEPQTAIRSAPQPPAVRAMPQQSLVPPLPPEEQPPPTTTPLLQRIAKEIREAAPADRDAIVQRAQPYIQQEQAKVSQAHEIWKEKQTLRRQLELEQYKLRAGAPKTEADIAHVQAQTAAQQLQDVSGKMVRNPDGSYSPPRITGVDQNAVPDVKLNESQTKALTYHDWALIGNETVKKNEKLLAEGGAQAALGKTPFIGNALLSAKYRKAQAGADQFVNAFMRATSGGAYGEAEAAREAKALLPRVSDDPQTLELKRTQRDAFIKNLYGGLGDGKKLADFYGKERTAKEAQKREKLNTEMEGKDKSKTYQKGSVFREWVDDHWEEH